MKRYFPIAALYAICNNLMLYNLKNNHPIVYQILHSSRLLMVAVVWQCFFKSEISTQRRTALVLITIGFLIKCLKYDVGNEIKVDTSWFQFFASTCLILLEAGCSVIASVYNELNLKKIECDQFLQNICLYINSIFINLVIFCICPGIEGGQTPSLLTKPTISIAISLAAAGLLTAMILHSAGSVTKGVVSASITIVTYFIDVCFYKYKLFGSEAISVLFVTLGSAVYTINNPQKQKTYNMKKKSKFLGTCLLVFSFLIYHQYHERTGLHLSLNDFIDTSYFAELGKMERRDLCTSLTNELNISTTGVTPVKVQRIGQAEAMVSYIVTRLYEINAPVTILFGTLLHEYRNGTGSNPCVTYELTDKDLDIGLFEAHWHVVYSMRSELSELFGWRVKIQNSVRLMMVMVPPGFKEKGSVDNFQIDIYGFKTNHPKEGLLYFPWDKITFAIDGFLPLRKYKSIPPLTDFKNSVEKDLFINVPYNSECFLKNQYGDNFMTPDKSRGYFWTHSAMNSPCNSLENVTKSEMKELQRQLSFPKTIPYNITYNVTKFRVEFDERIVRKQTLNKALY